MAGARFGHLTFMTRHSTHPTTTIRDNAASARYELYVEDELAGYLSYRRDGDRIVYKSTVVQPEHRGRGLAADLVRHAVEDAEREGLSMTTTCWYVDEWLARNR